MGIDCGEHRVIVRDRCTVGGPRVAPQVVDEVGQALALVGQSLEVALLQGLGEPGQLFQDLAPAPGDGLLIDASAAGPTVS